MSENSFDPDEFKCSSTTNKSESQKVDQGSNPKLQDKKAVSGLKPEPYGRRVMQHSATMLWEVKLPLSFWTLNMRGVFSITGLLDSDTTDSFIDRGVIDHHKLKVEMLVYNADGGCNRLGNITGYVDLEPSPCFILYSKLVTIRSSCNCM